jgi:hypothetical protein
MKVLIVLIVGFASTGVLLGQTARSGTELVVRVEVRRLPGTSVTDDAARILQSQAPGGSAEVTYVTDGQAVRSTTSGHVFVFDERTVKLVPRGSADVYLLNTSDRTYQVMSGNSSVFGSQKPEFHFQSTGRSKTILGHNARQVTGWHRVDLPPFPGEQQHVRELRADIDNWCSSTLPISAAMSRMMDITQRWFGGADAQYDKTCPLPLQSAVKVSILPGYEIVSMTQSIRPLSQVPPETFQIPAGYRQISKDGKGAAKQAPSQ